MAIRKPAFFSPMARRSVAGAPEGWTFPPRWLRIALKSRRDCWSQCSGGSNAAT